MSDFQSFRDVVLEDEDLQEQVISIVNTTTANGSGLGNERLQSIPFYWIVPAISTMTHPPVFTG